MKWMSGVLGLLLVVGCGAEDQEAAPMMQEAQNNGGDPCQGARCVGAPAPSWSLEDVQPQSARFGQSYGLEVFEGQVVLVALLASWCPYCQQQAELLEGMLAELRAEGLEVEFVTLNAANAADTQENLLALCSFPLLQDTEEASAWGKHEGSKDDLFVYRPDGTLHLYMSRQQYNTSLATPEGYALVKETLREAR
jgi:thiol-disulfide isomerase/thioredoxin